MNYSNFGICGSDSFISKEEGLLKILYKSVFNFQHNIKTINSINPAYINIYSQMEIKNIITDNFTKYLINKKVKVNLKKIIFKPNNQSNSACSNNVMYPF